ncbi:MAG TPA: DUF2845 domain-containing protein [Polyangiaceae bacterium]|nr:DUF2845 domain-containing protein [Polyangiaceae bacterium]
MRSPAAELVAGTMGAILLTASAARADSLSCNGRIVSQGDTLYQVRSLCGEPDDAQHRIETRTVRHRVRVACARDQNPSGQCDTTVERSTDVVVDEWTYDFGRQRFIRFLTFIDGRLARVQTGGYGTRDDR